MQNNMSYTLISVIVALIWTTSIHCMDEDRTNNLNLVSSQDLKDLRSSIIMATNGECPQQESSSWFSLPNLTNWRNWFMDGLYGTDINVISEFDKGTLTKDTLAKNTTLQQRAREAIEAAILYKRTTNLCVLLNQLHKLDMLSFYENYHPLMAKFFNDALVAYFPNPPIQRMDSAQLIQILKTMKIAQYPIDVNDSVREKIDLFLAEQTARKVAAFKNNYENMQAVMKPIHEDIKTYQDVLLEAKEIVLLQKSLKGENNLTKEQVKEELAVADNARELHTLYKAITIFLGKK